MMTMQGPSKQIVISKYQQPCFYTCLRTLTLEILIPSNLL